MLLKPRRFTYKTKQKRRCFYYKKKNILNYGTVGFKIISPIKVLNKKLYRFFLLIRRGSKKPDKTYRKTWINIFPHFPLTKKVLGSRMGKGRGKFTGWFFNLPAGLIIVEYRNLRPGRSLYFYRQIKARVSTKITILYLFRYKKQYSILKNSNSSKYYFFR